MGKKKVIQKTKEELIKESETVETALQKKTQTSAKYKIEKGKIYINASYNNIIITVTDEKGNVITWMSAGAIGFSGPKKATPFAATKVAEAVYEKIQKSGPATVDILVRGLGGGRDAAIRSFINKGLNILSLKDITPIPHNGPRPPKVRRV
ncbi:MAG: 30S ribosomal protein S11 [Minisyncoccia bacterium]